MKRSAGGDATRDSAAATVEIDVRVIPRAKKTAIGGERDGALVVRVAAPPVDGAANDALIDFLSSTLRIPRRAITIVSGERGRQKRIAISGVTADAVRALLTLA
jgi:uncharacterized protein (TIGR00251 family)